MDTAIKHPMPDNLYCVGGDIKPCSINQSSAFIQNR